MRELLHAMQFRPRPPPQVRDRRPAQRPPRSDRDCPLDTARARCLWHVGGTAGVNDDRSNVAATAPNSAGKVRPVLDDSLLRGPRLTTWPGRVVTWACRPWSV